MVQDERHDNVGMIERVMWSGVRTKEKSQLKLQGSYSSPLFRIFKINTRTITWVFATDCSAALCLNLFQFLV